jgi:hypothetical protein
VLSTNQAKLRFDAGRELAVNLSQLRHVDYGYASTSHAAQGATMDQVIVDVDSMRSAQLVNRRQFYTTTCGVIYPAMCIAAITSCGTAPWAVKLLSRD